MMKRNRSRVKQEENEMHLLRKASRVGGNRTTKAQETRGPDCHYHSPFTQINVILMIYSKIIVIMIINNQGSIKC